MENNYSKKDINQIMGNNIRYIRKSNKLSQEKFAEQVELSPQFVSDVERGIEGISLMTALKICNTMNCSPLVLFANLINFENCNEEINNFMKLSDKNKNTVIDIIIALLNMQ